MKKAFLTIFSFLFVLSIAISCSKSNPTSPAPTATNTPVPTATQTGLFVEKAVIVQEQSSHGVGNANATIILRYGNSLGAYVQGATVSIGGVVLTNSSAGTYTAAISNIAAGTTLNLSISSLAGNATSSIEAPWDCEVTAPTDGTYQSAGSHLDVDWRPYIVSGTLPQKRRMKLWRLSDLQIYTNSIAAVLYTSTTTTIPANTLPNCGIIYIRVYGINEAAIVGANGGSVTFSMENSENTRYINMTP